MHRDIKPSDVLITSSQEPALTDFEIAGRLQEVAGEDEVRISYPWSPPELLDGRSNGSVSSDVYSLGATIWHLLVGRSPFALPAGDNSNGALTARILHAAPPYVWAGLAVLAAAVTVITLVITGGGDGPDREAATDPTAPATPEPIAPEAPTEQPTVTGALTDHGSGPLGKRSGARSASRRG